MLYFFLHMGISIFVNYFAFTCRVRQVNSNSPWIGLFKYIPSVSLIWGRLSETRPPVKYRIICIQITGRFNLHSRIIFSKWVRYFSFHFKLTTEFEVFRISWIISIPLKCYRSHDVTSAEYFDLFLVTFHQKTTINVFFDFNMMGWTT